MKYFKTLCNPSEPEALKKKFPEYKSFVQFESGKRYFFTIPAKTIQAMQKRKTELIDKFLAEPSHINGKRKTIGMVLNSEECDFVKECDERRISRFANYKDI